MYKGSKHAGNVVISNHATSNMSRDSQFSSIVKLGAPTKIARLRHTLQQQLFLEVFPRNILIQEWQEHNGTEIIKISIKG